MRGGFAELFRTKLAPWWAANKRLVILTFEIFWLLVFSLERMTNVNAVDIPQFIYVNF